MVLLQLNFIIKDRYGYERYGFTEVEQDDIDNPTNEGGDSIEELTINGYQLRDFNEIGEF